MKTPLLSVCIITYNHEKYIRDAIESVLMQKVNFEFDIIIADDNSSDNTRKIILEYKEKYPNRFHLIFQKKNVGAARNWLDLIYFPKSKYIGYLEGDDYWTDQYKLQKQVDFLELNNDYNIIWSNYSMVTENNQVKANCLNFDHSNLVTTKSFFPYRTMTLTCVFRTQSLFRYDLNSFKHTKDNTLYFCCLKDAKGHILKDDTAMYRIHQNSTFSSRDEYFKLVQNILNFYEIYFKIEKNKELMIQLENWSRQISLKRIHKIGLKLFFKVLHIRIIFFLNQKAFKVNA